MKTTWISAMRRHGQPSVKGGHKFRNSGVPGLYLLRFPANVEFENEPVSVPITDVFDLHPFAPRDVKAAVEAYLEEAYSLGFTALRIIHGRGIGAQRETVRKVLARTPFVLAYSDAPAEAGGWGATIVTLAPTRL
jgi:hypothetical protein